MQDILGESLRKLKRERVKRTRMIVILLVLSLLVSTDVFWWLRQPGLTLAGDADCGIIEHLHDDSCQNSETTCPLAEHTHTIHCYSDETADVETQADWQKLFENYPYTGTLSDDLVGIAKTQVGYAESEHNFEVDAGGIRRGYTRYGAWYGTPYSDWSATFVSFCLHYAGADADEFPYNIGADAMAGQWRKLGRYVSVGNYKPVSGDLIFFSDHTVGIVAEVQSTACYVIRGDQENAVQSTLVSLADESILGFGLVSRKTSPSKLYATMNNSAAQTQNDVTDLIAYLDQVFGSYSFSLLDVYNHEVPKDEFGHYVVHANTTYQFSLIAYSREGFTPGTYQYVLPGDVMIDATINGVSDELLLPDGVTSLGSWSIENNVLTIELNENANTRTDVTISATVGMIFPQQDEPIEFDGNVTVTVEKPRDEVVVTEVRKWGEQGNPDNANGGDSVKNNKTDPTKLYWTVCIEGNQESSIPGSVVKDAVSDWGHAHHYTASDIAAGLRFGASVVNPNNTEESYWHRWTVYAGDENLVWDENGWTYIMPETVWCELGHEVVLGNEHWTYYVEYTSTPDHTNLAGDLDYYNSISFDDITGHGWGSFIQTDLEVDIAKNGTLVTDGNGAKVVWEVNVTIPKYTPGENTKGDCYWDLSDYLAVVNEWGNPIEYIGNTIKRGTVTANYRGRTITVPPIYEATEHDPYALVMYNPWQEGYYDVQEIVILRRCDCTEEHCPKWDGKCNTWTYEDANGVWHPPGDYCDCWLDEEDTTFTFTYETDVTEALVKYEGTGYGIKNIARLRSAQFAGDEAIATVPFPGILKKEGSKFENLIATYTVTVNEAKLNLTDGSPLLIRDTMTDTLVFLRGTLTVKAVDAAGGEVYLQEDVDYTYTYHGESNIVENGKKVHILEVEIQHPQPVTYFLEYDTMLYIPAGTAQSVQYQNSATIELWDNKTIADIGANKIYPDVVVASNYFAVLLHKITADGTKTGLPGAQLGVFNEHGGLILSKYTDGDGRILFETDVANGIILREHELYYIQEITAPNGYKLDDTKHWFCFCSKADGTCDVYQNLVGYKDLVRVPFESVGHIDITNELLTYDLPATGGSGVYPLIHVSMVFIVIPLVYRFIRRRKRERRGVG